VARYIDEPASPRQQLLVATSAGGVVGFGAFGPSRDGDLQGREVGEIYATYLKPEVWRRGVGNRLLAEVERRLAGIRLDAKGRSRRSPCPRSP
jgi:GNAT superfamily N-acetyltransferase